MADQEKLHITTHCAERYAERIMGKDQRSDVAVYVAQNKEKIETDVNKFYEYGSLLYSGSLKDKNVVNVYLSGSWVLLTDKDNKRAITIYKIDFGLGEEFNKNFIEKMLSKIEESRNKYCDAVTTVEERKAAFQELISEYTDKANEYRRLAKNLDKEIEAYNDIISVMGDEIEVAKNELKQDIMLLVCKKEF